MNAFKTYAQSLRRHFGDPISPIGCILTTLPATKTGYYQVIISAFHFTWESEQQKTNKRAVKLIPTFLNLKLSKWAGKRMDEFATSPKLDGWQSHRRSQSRWSGKFLHILRGGPAFSLSLSLWSSRKTLATHCVYHTPILHTVRYYTKTESGSLSFPPHWYSQCRRKQKTLKIKTPKYH
jgi:hypothetical protein